MGLLNWLLGGSQSGRTRQTIVGGNNVSIRSNGRKNIITINGRTHTVEGENVQVINSRIYVDGKLVETIPAEEQDNAVHIKWEGDLASLDCTKCEITGDVRGDVDATSVTCGNVGGDVNGTTIKCGDVQGSLDGTNITCGEVNGNVDGTSVKIMKN